MSKFGKFLKRAGKKIQKAVKKNKKGLGVVLGVVGLGAVAGLAASASKAKHKVEMVKTQPIRHKITTAKYKELTSQGMTQAQIEAVYMNQPQASVSSGSGTLALSPSGKMNPAVIIAVVVGVIVLIFVIKK